MPPRGHFENGSECFRFFLVFPLFQGLEVPTWKRGVGGRKDSISFCLELYQEIGTILEKKPHHRQQRSSAY